MGTPLRGRHGSDGRRCALALAACTLALVAPLLVPQAARALALDVPAVAPLAVDVGVDVAPTDPAGLGLLYVDGSLARSLDLTPSVPATFKAVHFSLGTHRLRVVLRSRFGTVSSAEKTITCWGTRAPRLTEPVHAGLYPKRATFPVHVTIGTQRLTVLVNGKAQWTRSVVPPVTVPVTLALPHGVDTIEFRAENPVQRKSSTVTVTRPIWPLPGYSTVTSGFGWRIHPILGTRRFHSGIDVAAPWGARVVAAAAGKVVSAGADGGYGNCIVIDHGEGLTTRYGHLSRIDVKAGQRVTMGQRIGAVGSTGLSTGPHLHIEVHVNGEARNPLDYL